MLGSRHWFRVQVAEGVVVMGEAGRLGCTKVKGTASAVTRPVLGGVYFNCLAVLLLHCQCKYVRSLCACVTELQCRH